MISIVKGHHHNTHRSRETKIAKFREQSFFDFASDTFSHHHYAIDNSTLDLM